MKRLAAGIAGASLALGLGLVPSAGAQTVGSADTGSHDQATTTSSASAAYTPPKLRWGRCDNATLRAYGAQCAMLTVPLDYSKPKGTTIKLAVSRVRHQSSAKDYQGVMLVNPGGPGGSGLIYSVFGQGSFVPGDGDLDYDWIGFDPRGVGSSRPALSCNGTYFRGDRPNYLPTTEARERVWLRRSAHYATDCRYSRGGELLDHLKTTDTIKDMESLRVALGQSRINFYGFSYGTYLAEVYATLHPTRVRRFVLDSSVDPTKVWYQANLDQDKAFEKTITVYFRWLAKYDSVYHLGTNADVIAANYYRELDRLDAHPAAGGVVGPDELTDVLLSAGYYVYGWEDIAKAYSALLNRGDGSAIASMYTGSNPTGPGADNGYAVYLGTQCTDTPWPSDWNRVRTDNWRTYAVAPFETWGNAWFNGPCSFWKGQAAPHPVKVTGTKVTSKILMIDETLDAATPYAGSLRVRRLFPTASLIEGVGGTTHAGTLSGVACTDDAIGRYLTDGTVPTRTAGNHSDKKCPPVPQPDPTAPSAQSRQAVPFDLHAQLMRAQRP